MDEIKLVRKLVEEGSITPLPNRVEYASPTFEVVIQIDEDSSISIILTDEAYFKLLEFDA